MAINPEVLTAIFGDEMPKLDSLRQSTGDVSKLGKALEGPGGPKDDQIVAQVEDEQGNVEPARLSPGEFVIQQPAMVYLGDGDEVLGAKFMDYIQNNPEMLDKIREMVLEQLGK
jgi:hypothetical protein